MAQDVSDSFVKQYESDYHLAFQRKSSVFRPTIRVHTDVEGSTDTFQVIGKGSATTKGRHSRVPPMNVSHTPVECTLTDHYAGDFVDKLDLEKLNIDERMALAEAGAAAINRKIDDLVTTAMNGVTTLSTAAWTLDIARSMVEALSDNDVEFGRGDVYGAVGYRQWNIMMKDAAFGSSDFVGDHPMKTYPDAKYWSGCWWFPCSGNLLPKTGTDRSTFLYHKNAVGAAIGCDVEVDITWEGPEVAWWINHMMSMGSVVIDSTGIVKHLATE